MKYTLLILMLLIVISCQKMLAQNEVLDLDAILHIDEQRLAKIDAAFAAMNQVQRAGAYIESIADLVGSQTVPLPVGIKKGDYELIIQKITYDAVTEKFKIFASCAFTFKENGQKIAFEGEANIDGQKGLGTTGSLKLIAPVKRDMGKQLTLVVLNDTKVNFGCEGIESFDARLGLLITSDKIIEVSADGTPTGKPVATLFESSFTNFDRFTASFSFNHSFMFKGLNDVIFTLKGAVIDQDDISTPSSIQFPENYFGDRNASEKNLWRGISISEASVALPRALKKPDENGNTGERITLALKKVIFDNNGFSAYVEADNILHNNALPKGQWGISVNDILLDLQKNELIGFGFGGELNIPPFGDNSLTPYQASYNANTGEYDFTAGLKGSYEFPVFRAKLDLLETSTIEVLMRDSEIYPFINASGKISINAPINEEDSTKKFSLPDVTFEQMQISREEPCIKIGAIGVSGNITSPKIAGFELSISDIRAFNDSRGTGLAFDAGIKLNELFEGKTGILLFGDYRKFKFDHLGLDKAYVAYNSNAFSLSGGVMFKNGDAVYGTGFRGELALTVVDKFSFKAVGVFGKYNDYRYFLTDVFFDVDPSAGIPVTALSFYGFGGGMYKHMQQSALPSASEFGASLSGINYVPDKKVGMGFMAATKFGLLGAPGAFNANVSFEIQFNQNQGVNFIQMRGEGAFMNAPEKLGSLHDNINQKVKRFERNSGKLSLAKKSDLGVPDLKSTNILSAKMNFFYDMANKTFTADLATYLDAGYIKGIGAQGKLGWASARVSPSGWYTYIGTPTDRLGIDIVNLVKGTTYFMMGDNIPELPLPPDKVYSKLSAEKRAQIQNRQTGGMDQGSGLAFGQSFRVGFDARLFPFYASMDVELGGEFLLKNYGTGAYCSGGSGTLGINGWYAKGQAWAYAQAAIGMEAKLFGKVRNFDLMNLTSGILLQGEGPNPFHFSGSVFGTYNVMGGLISGDCNFDFEIGQACIVAGGSPFGADVIASLTPGDNETDVNVFTAPQLVLNIPANLTMRIEESPGRYSDYKISIEAFTVRYKETQKAITGSYELSSDGKVYLFDPDEPFESFTTIEMVAKVGFKHKVSGSWVNVTDAAGKPVIEEKTCGFTSGERPDHIMPEHVKYSYPANRQFNFYADEYASGYIQLTENYSYLFTTDIPEGFTQVVRILQNDAPVKDVGFTHRSFAAGNPVRLEVDFNMASIPYGNDAIYKLALINKPEHADAAINSNIESLTTQARAGSGEMTITTQHATGNMENLKIKEIYSLYFRTSDYNTLNAKIAAIDPSGTGWRYYIEPHVHDVKANVFEDEGFDKYEYDRDDPLISIEADLSETPWYKGSVYEDMYTVVDPTTLQRGAELDKLGYPPVKAVEIRNNNRQKSLTDDEIGMGYSDYASVPGNITYSVPCRAAQDFALVQNYLAHKKANGLPLSRTEEKILATLTRHDVIKGYYPIIISYHLPGKSDIKFKIDEEMYNPVN